jgi:hypothetical protein
MLTFVLQRVTVSGPRFSDLRTGYGALSIPFRRLPLRNRKRGAVSGDIDSSYLLVLIGQVGL